MSKTIPEITENWLEFRAKYSPDLIALQEKGRKISYGELRDLVIQTSENLVNKGVREGEKVAIVPQNKIEFPILIFALWNIGAVPLLLHKRWTEKERQEAMQKAECKKFLEVEEALATTKEKSSSPLSSFDSNKTAVIIYTSGTTSAPKGVEITFANLYFNAILFGEFFNAKEKEVWLASLPFYHIGGFAMLTRSAIWGGTVFFTDKIKSTEIAEVLAEVKVHYLSLVPTQLKELLELNSSLLTKLKSLLLGGAPSEKDLIENAIRLNIPLVKVYGSTETTSLVAAIKGKDLQNYPEASGKAIPPAEIKILTEEGTEVRKEEIGEIAIKSPTVAKGYLNLPSLTSEKFFGDFLKTGDYGYLNKEGFLFLLSRREDLIITGGENVSPAEVKEAILQIEGIKDCAVTSLEDEKWGQIVVAALVGKEKEENKIKKNLRSSLADFKIPKKIIFVDALPRNAMGKIETRKLKELFRKT